MRIAELSSLLYRPTRRPRLTLVRDRIPTSMDTANRRGFYRVQYPLPARPRLLLDSPGAVHAVCEVIECSERGLRFQTPTQWMLPVGSTVSGTMSFARGPSVRVAGSVVRMQQDEVAILLNRQAIPLATVLDEQRWLRANYADEGTA